MREVLTDESPTSYTYLVGTNHGRTESDVLCDVSESRPSLKRLVTAPLDVALGLVLNLARTRAAKRV
jgi:hypothetical protein